MTTPTNRRAPDPSQSQIAQRAAEVREQWTDAEESRRRAQATEPIVFVTLAPSDIGLSMEPIETPI